MEQTKNTIMKTSQRLDLNVFLNMEKTDEKKNMLEILTKYFPREIIKEDNNFEYLKKCSESHPQSKILIITSRKFFLFMIDEGLFETLNCSIEFLFIYSKIFDYPKSIESKIGKIIFISDEYKLNQLLKENLLELPAINIKEDNSNLFYFDNYQSIENYLFHRHILEMFKEIKTKHTNLNLEKSRIKILLKQAEEDFIEYSKENHIVYYGTESDLEMLHSEIRENKFRDMKVVKWYTEDNFLRRMINSVLLSNDYIGFYKLRYVLYLLEEALLEFKLKEKTQIFYYSYFANEQDFLSLIKIGLIML